MSYSNKFSAKTPKNYFHACLKDENNQLLELGKGNISFEDHSVDFISDFVPLMKFKSTAKIIKLIDGEECHSFVGQVYLSSQTRLQLLNVTDSFITYKELQASQKVKIRGSVISASAQSSQEKPIEIEIFSISMNEVYFTIAKEHQPNQDLILQTDKPVRTNGIVLSIYRQLQFSKEKTVCYATIVRCPAGSNKALIDFLSPTYILFP